MTNEGSYEFDKLTLGDAELARLAEQARTVADLEKTLLEDIGAFPAQTLLELGCGPGFVTKLLAASSPGSQIVAVDLSTKLLATLGSRLSDGERGRVFPVLGDVSRLPVPDNWAEFAYARFLLQHVAKPATVFGEAYRALAPGGTFCVVDSDDGLVMHHPQVTEIGKLLEDSRAAQASAGGDRLIGRKLPGMLTDAGFEEVQTKVVCLTSSQMPFEILAEIAFGYKAALIGRRDELRGIIAKLLPEARSRRFFLSTGVVVAWGKKPAPSQR